jgi:hydroxyacylglutathione hydrolase
MTQAKALIIPVTPFQQNCTLLWCEATKRGVVIDPGGDLPDIERAIAQANVAVDKIWLTHGHVDHVAGAAALKARLKVPIRDPIGTICFSWSMSSRAAATSACKTHRA